MNSWVNIFDVVQVLHADIVFFYNVVIFFSLWEIDIDTSFFPELENLILLKGWWLISLGGCDNMRVWNL